jgi:hypothetical protein
MMKQLIYTLWIVLLVNPAFGVTYHVATTGDDSHDCIQAQFPSSPKQTIADGIRCLSSADTLMIAAGTYAEGIDGADIPPGMNFTTGTTKIIGAGSTSGTIIRPTSFWGVLLYGAQANIEFQSLEIDMSNGPDNDWEGIEIGEEANHIRFVNVKVHHGRQNIIVHKDVDTVEFSHIESYSAGAGACTSSGHTEGGLCHGAYLQGRNIILDSCSLHDNNGLGVQWYPSPRDGLMRNCIVYGNRGQTPEGNQATGILVWGTNIHIYNNTVYGNEYIGVWCVAGGEIRNNISYSNGDTNFYNPGDCPNSNNVTTNPNFVNPELADFRLEAWSNAIDAGEDLNQAVTVDKDNIPRPQGYLYDIGAYEFRPVYNF